MLDAIIKIWHNDIHTPNNWPRNKQTNSVRWKGIKTMRKATSDRTPSQLARRNIRHRRQHLIRELKKWAKGQRETIPTLRKPLAGAEEIYNRFGIRPGEDVFLPLANRNKWIEQKARRAFKYRKYEQRRKRRSENLFLKNWEKNISESCGTVRLDRPS